VRVWFLKGTNSTCGGCSTGCNLRIDHSARAIGGGIPGYTATDGKIYRTVGRRNPEVNKSWLCDEGRLSFHTLERWPRLRHASVGGAPKIITDVISAIHQRFEAIRQQHGDKAVAGLGSATNTNEALFLMKKYFNGRVDFRTGREVELYDEQQDELLRRLDKHPNTRGALDLGLNGEFGGLAGLRQLADNGQIRGMWISFHPQLVGDDAPEVINELQRLIAALEFSAVSTTHDFEWARKASVLLPMAAWSEEQGTYTNYAGRIQMTNRAVMPPGDAHPLHVYMAELLALSGVQISREPAVIFDWISREMPAYSAVDYDAIGLSGVAPAPIAAPQEVMR
jgi:NADH-quinone oxidoreductase subunit G